MVFLVEKHPNWTLFSVKGMSKDSQIPFLFRKPVNNVPFVRVLFKNLLLSSYPDPFLSDGL
jgi:hypothetical protein